jgi:cyanate permease
MSARPIETADRAHWGMLALAWSVYFGFGVVTASLPALITPIRTELGLSYSEVGIVLGTWQLVYIVSSYPSGLFVDRVGTRRALAVGALLVAISALWRARAEGFGELLMAVGLFGLGGPIISIGLPKVIASWFAGRPRQIAAGVYTTGSNSGSVISLAITNSVVLPLVGSWQAVCVGYALIVGAIAATWFLLAREPERRAAGRADGVSFAQACRTVLRTRAVWLVVIVGFAGFMTGHGFRNWLPQIMESRGFSPSDAGFLAAVPGLSSIAGSLIISRLAAVVSRKQIVMVLLAVIGLSLLTIAVASGPVLVVVLVVQGFCAGAMLPLLMSTLMDLREVGAAAMGAAAGIYFAVGEVGGFSGPAVMGFLKDSTGSFTTGLIMLAAISIAMLVPTAMLPRQGR